MTVSKLVTNLCIFSALFQNFCQSLQISKETKIDIRVKEGEPYDLNCIVDKNWDFCTWTNINSDQKCLIVQNRANSECTELRGTEIDHPRVFSYQINDKTCTLRISDAIIQDNTEWRCLIHSGVALVEATVNVTVYSPTTLGFQSKPNRAVRAGKWLIF